jgi:hypothetical protein
MLQNKHPRRPIPPAHRDLLRASKKGLAVKNAAAFESLQLHQYDQSYSFDTAEIPALGSANRRESSNTRKYPDQTLSTGNGESRTIA